MLRVTLMMVPVVYAFSATTVTATAAEADKPAPLILQTKPRRTADDPRARRVQSKRTRPRPPSRKARRPSSKKPTDVSPDDLLRLRLDLIEVETTPTVAAGLDLDASWAARSLPDLLGELGKHGSANLRYRLDHRMLIGKPFFVTSGSNVPVIRGAKTLDDGRVQSSVEYKDVGCVIEARAAWFPTTTTDADRPLVQLELETEVSSLRFDTPVEITHGMKAPLFVEHQQRYSILQRLGETVLLSTFAAPVVDPNGALVPSMLIWRVRITSAGEIPPTNPAGDDEHTK